MESNTLGQAIRGGANRLVCWATPMLLVLATLSPSTQAQTAALAAPNVVAISPRLVTSGQPSAAALGELGAQGFGAVIYLAPPTVRDAVRDEQAIVERQALLYANIPIYFNNPTEADFEAFTAALAAAGDRKVLVHCQVNMRASSMVFLHRVLIGHEQPEKAYEAVAKVWSPEGPWRALRVRLLKSHRIDFEPY